MEISKQRNQQVQETCGQKEHGEFPDLKEGSKAATWGRGKVCELGGAHKIGTLSPVLDFSLCTHGNVKLVGQSG